jgi:hypothetical protein
MSKTEAGNDIQTLIDLMNARGGPHLIQMKDEKTGIEANRFLYPQGMVMFDADEAIDALRDRPRRRKGSHTALDLDSLIGLANRFKDAGSVLFLDGNQSQPTLKAIINFHEGNGDGDGVASGDGNGVGGAAVSGAANDNKARHGDHTITYAFPFSKEYQAWKGHDGKVMEVAEFAEFLEDRIADVAVPSPQLLDVLGPRQAGGDFGERTPDEELAYFAYINKATFATPQRLMELAEGLSLTESAVIKNRARLASGEMQIQFETEHKDATGQPLAVPSLFLIEIPIFHNDQVVWRLAVRLRYRVIAGKVMWLYQLHRLDFALDFAMRDAARRVVEATALPLFQGRA